MWLILQLFHFKSPYLWNQITLLMEPNGALFPLSPLHISLPPFVAPSPDCPVPPEHSCLLLAAALLSHSPTLLITPPSPRPCTARLVFSNSASAQSRARPSVLALSAASPSPGLQIRGRATRWAAAPVLALLEAAQRWSPPCLPPCSWALSFTFAAVLPLWAFLYGPEQRLTASGPNWSAELSFFRPCPSLLGLFPSPLAISGAGGCWQELSCISGRGLAPGILRFLLRPLRFFVFPHQWPLKFFHTPVGSWRWIPVRKIAFCSVPK
jgi:hypothetical protein